MIAKGMAELLRSVKHLIRDGMPGRTDEDVNKFIEAAQAEVLKNDYHAYYNMYLSLRFELTVVLLFVHSDHRWCMIVWGWRFKDTSTPWIKSHSAAF